MKKKILIFVSIFLSSSFFSQTIIDFFENIPDSSILNLTKDERQKITKYSADNKTHADAVYDLNQNKLTYSFSNVDIKNGYLRLVGGMEGFLEMCYWNLRSGQKLIAVYQEGCGPVCYVEEFDFYIYDGKKYTPLNFKNVIPDIRQNFFKDNYINNHTKMEKEGIIASLLFELPRKGKNIIAKWGNEDSKETYQKYNIIGDRMNLIWKDGRFEKGDIFWSK